jgi:hypothetical protein
LVDEAFGVDFGAAGLEVLFSLMSCSTSESYLA